MRPIPAKLREEIASDKFMGKCCITGSYNVSWEHCWCYGKGGQINERCAIVPLRRDLNTSHPQRDVKNKCRFISLQRAKRLGVWEELKNKYPKKDWEQTYQYLNKLYGKKSREKKPPSRAQLRKGSSGEIQAGTL